MKTIIILNWIKKHILPLLLVIMGVVDQTTNLLIQLLGEIKAPTWVGTLLRIIIISIGAFKLYYTDAKKNK